MVPIECPKCQSTKIKKNGHIHNGKQNHQCNECKREFVLEPKNLPISEDTKNTIRLLLLERISLHGICRVVKVSITWLLLFVVKVYDEIPETLEDSLQVVEQREDVVFVTLDAQADEMWSFVDNQENKQWVWLALDSHTRQIIAFYVGDRGQQSAEKLWEMVPNIYKKDARFHTDSWDAYKQVIPEHQHFVSHSQTFYIERFNCTLRQRVSRLVRLSLSFSKKIEDHILAIRYFIYHYNKALLV